MKGFTHFDSTANLKITNIKHSAHPDLVNFCVHLCKMLKNDVMSPRRQTQPRPCADRRQDKTCKQLLGGNTRNHRQQTMTHAPVNLPEPLWCPYIPKGHCGYARGFSEGHGHVFCV